MDNVNDIHRVVRSELFSLMPMQGRICFGYLTPEDAGPNTLGDLFEQDLDFLMVEVMIDDVRRAGPSTSSPRRVWGHIEFALHSKGRLNTYTLASTLEAVANHFREETLQGVRFRDFTPSGEARDRGFTASTGVLPFDFETRAKHDN
jgi:hypothetical protein